MKKIEKPVETPKATEIKYQKNPLLKSKEPS